MAFTVQQGQSTQMTIHLFDSSGNEVTTVPAGGQLTAHESSNGQLGTFTQSSTDPRVFTFTAAANAGGGEDAITANFLNSDGSAATSDTETMNITAPPPVHIASVKFSQP